ncbi:MAG: GGDEF domain-containing protein [Archangiaceae bacterium]|nr:GGDEF domain-containing protein [Archangiaceae bacterium]
MDVEALLEAEKRRRGDPDPVSGAFSRLALTQGTLLKEEYDHGTHFFAGGAVLGAAVVDTVHFTHLNMEHGFAVGDRVLAAQVKALREQCPRGKVVRIHGDAFAVVLGPTADQPVEASLRPKLHAALEKATRDALGRSEPVRFWVALLKLAVKDPPNHDVLGPLLWGECERALLIEQRGLEGAGTVLERSVDFHATL